MARKRINTPKLAQARRTPVEREVHAKVNDTFHQSQTRHQFVKQAGTQELVKAITDFGTIAGEVEKKTNKQFDVQNLAYANLTLSKGQVDLGTVLKKYPNKTREELLELEEIKDINDTFLNIKEEIRAPFLADFQGLQYKAVEQRQLALDHADTINLASDTLSHEASNWKLLDEKQQQEKLKSFQTLVLSEAFGASNEELNAMLLAEATSSIKEGDDSTYILDFLEESGEISGEMRKQIATWRVEAGKKTALQKTELLDKFNNWSEQFLYGSEDEPPTFALTRDSLKGWYAQGVTAAQGQSMLDKQRRGKAKYLAAAGEHNEVAEATSALVNGTDLTNVDSKYRNKGYSLLEDFIKNKHAKKIADEGGEPLSRTQLDSSIFKILGRSGVVDTNIKSVLEAGLLSIGAQDYDGKASPGFTAVIDRVKIAEENGYLAVLDLPKPVQAIWSRYKSLTTTGGMQKEEAYAAINKAMNNPNISLAANAYSVDASGDEAALFNDLTTSFINELTDVSGWDHFVMALDPTEDQADYNYKMASSTQHVVGDLIAYTNALVATGTPKAEAQRLAMEEAKEGYVNIRGIFYNKRGIQLGTHGQAHIEARQEGVIDAYLEGSNDRYEAEELAMIPTSNGNFILVDVSTTIPVSNNEGQVVRMSADELLGKKSGIGFELQKNVELKQAKAALKKSSKKKETSSTSYWGGLGDNLETPSKVKQATELETQKTALVSLAKLGDKESSGMEEIGAAIQSYIPSEAKRTQVIQAVQNALSSKADVIAEGAKATGMSLGEASIKVAETYDEVMATVSDSLKEVIPDTAKREEIVKVLTQSLTKNATAAGEDLAEVAAASVKGVGKAVIAGGEALEQGVTAAVKGIGEAVSTGAEPIGEGIASVGRAVIQGASSSLETLQNLIPSEAQRTQVIQAVQEAVSTKAAELAEMAEEAASSVTKTAQEKAGMVEKAYTEILSTVEETLEDVIPDPVERKEIVEAITQSLTKNTTAALKSGGQVVTSAKEAVAAIATSVGESLKRKPTITETEKATLPSLSTFIANARQEKVLNELTPASYDIDGKFVSKVTLLDQILKAKELGATLPDLLKVLDGEKRTFVQQLYAISP